MQQTQRVDHDTAAALALLTAWEAAKRRGAIAMRWDGARWVVLIAREWVALTTTAADAPLPVASAPVSAAPVADTAPPN